jgi:beta-glucuronidase
MSTLYPQNNSARMMLDLGGVWDFRFQGDETWQPIAVPASYNDQNPDPRFRKTAGIVEYRRKITIPAGWKGMRVCLRFDAVAHNARILLNGREIATHRGGFLPFEVELNGLLEAGGTAELTVEADNRISHNTLPIGTEGETAFFGSDNPGIPSVEAGKKMQIERGINRPAFDFFNYTGIQRPVRLLATPGRYIRDITLVPALNGEVRYETETAGEGGELPAEVTAEVLDATGNPVARCSGRTGILKIDNPQLWEPSPGTPYLYTARFSYGDDLYELPFGIREVRVEGTRFLINGRPFRFHGPCKHEDSPFHGRGVDQCLNVTDINLYHWLHANCFRTSHYPYAEEMYQLCDREGIVVVDETPAVGMWASENYGWNLAEYHEQVLKDMIARDKNHPCVVMWSVGNEPDTDSLPDKAYDYWMPLYEAAHKADPQNRPVTVVGCQNRYDRDRVIRAMDVVMINRYYGWYNLSGDLEAAKYAFRVELDWWESRHKPVILSEYGADTIAGMHGAAEEMFTEEYQVAYYEAMSECLDERDFVIGEMPWNFADFATCEGPMRAGGNRKGLFTRDRRPKMAAHYFRNRWGRK